MWTKLPEGFNDDTAFCLALVSSTGVAISPGSGFGPGGVGYVRFALVQEEAVLIDAAKRVGEFLVSEAGEKLRGAAVRAEGEAGGKLRGAGCQGDGDADGGGAGEGQGAGGEGRASEDAPAGQGVVMQQLRRRGSSISQEAPSQERPHHHHHHHHRHHEHHHHHQADGGLRHGEEEEDGRDHLWQ